MFAEALIVTDAIYDVQEPDNCPRTFATHFSKGIGLRLLDFNFAPFYQIPWLRWLNFYLGSRERRYRVEKKHS